jgi:flagellar motor protein MotB
MARRRAAPKENHDRWLVSYADLVTLLFAFFVVMFASTQSDHARAKKISQAVEKALNSGTTPPKISAILGGTVDDKGRADRHWERALTRSRCSSWRHFRTRRRAIRSFQ